MGHWRVSGKSCQISDTDMPLYLPRSYSTQGLEILKYRIESPEDSFGSVLRNLVGGF